MTIFREKIATKHDGGDGRSNGYLGKRFTAALTLVAVIIAGSMLSSLEAIGQSAPFTGAPVIAADPALGALACGHVPSILATPSPPDFDSKRDKGSDCDGDCNCKRDRDRDCEVSPYRV